jgi:hypothetical protein
MHLICGVCLDGHESLTVGTDLFPPTCEICRLEIKSGERFVVDEQGYTDALTRFYGVDHTGRDVW